MDARAPARGGLGRRLRYAALGLVLGLPAPARGAPRDPNELPFMPAPYGQPRRASRRVLAFDDGIHRSPARFTLHLEPAFASLRAPLLGRPAEPHWGGGSAVGLDVGLLGAFGLRFSGSYTGHPLSARTSREDGQSPRPTAPAGTLHVAQAGIGLLYLLDIGRVRPVLELGLGTLFFVAPEGVQAGQRDQACLADGRCDLGLRCDPDRVCRVEPAFELHGSFAVDVAVHRRVSVGAGLRYFAFVTAPAEYPIYLLATGRLGIRF